MPWRRCWHEQKDDESQVAMKKSDCVSKALAWRKKCYRQKCDHNWENNEEVAVTNLWSFYSPSTGHIIRGECEQLALIVRYIG